MKIKENKRIIEVEEHGIEILISEEDYRTLKKYNELDFLVNYISNTTQDYGSTGIMTEPLVNAKVLNEIDGEIEVTIDWEVRDMESTD